MTRRRVPTPKELETMADDTREALGRLLEAGYETEVRTIEDFVRGYREWCDETVRIAREVSKELGKQLENANKERERRISIPVRKDL